MIRLITDTSCLYTPQEGLANGVTIMPLSVSINKQHYREFVDINSDEFYELIKAGHIPTSSQPPIGEVMEIYEQYPNDEILHLCMADGLSGTYQSALSARDGMEHKENIHIYNSKTLCGPHRCMIDHLIKMINNGASLTECKAYLDRVIPTAISFLIPQDFNFLKRGGRLTPMAATLGGLLKLKPIMTQVNDGQRLEKFDLARTLNKAIDLIAAELKKYGVDENWQLSVTHAFVKEQAEKIVSKLKEVFPHTEIILGELSPAFITQGGPECIAIQAIQK